MTGDQVVSGLILPLWEEVFWPFLDAWDSVRLRTASYAVSHSELFFFLLKKEPMVLRELVRLGRVKACALIGLHMMAEEMSWRSDSGSSVSSSSSGENNVGNDALLVIGPQGSGDTIALFLQDCEVAKEALSCHTALGVPGNA